MSVLKLKVVSGRPNSYLIQNFQAVGGDRQIAERIKQYVERVFSGGEVAVSATTPRSIEVVVEGSETEASGSFTLSSVVATDACSINGVTFTAVASGATGNQFNVGADDEETAENLAAAIAASESALVSDFIAFAEAQGEIVALTAYPGVMGNAVTIASADATIVASGARLEGGTADASALTLTF